jgi:hypothetical protein
MSELFYPVNDFGPVMKGLAIGGLGIVHVFLAQFAIGGGMLMCYFQWLAQARGNDLARKFTDGFFKFLVLVSFVVGAVTGVGMWFTSIQVSPRTIGLMVHWFHWIWAIEWTFFCLEIASGYLFYRYGSRLPDRVRMTLLVTYSVAAWFSLFWINGILAWQLTPGEWIKTHNVWTGLFNASFWPSLLFRTITSMTIASLVACVVINVIPSFTRDERASLIHIAARFLAPMVLMPLLGIWYFLTIPADSRSWVLGGSAAMTLFFTMGAGASLLVGVYAIFGLLREQLFINGATAALLASLAFAATAGGEFVREGVRKPYTIRNLLYSNSIRHDEVAILRERGCIVDDPYPLRGAELLPNSQLAMGAQVFRTQCSVCHTLDGANGLLPLTDTWSGEQLRLNISQLQRTKPFMPPFAGNAEEVEALAQWLSWHNAKSPREWPATENPEMLARIDAWLREAGTNSGLALMQAGED